jgi:hypothetical protein
MDRHSGLFPFRSNYESYRQSVGLLGRGSARRKAATHTGQHQQTVISVIYAWSGIRTHYHNVWEGENISCRRPHGHCDRHVMTSEIIYRLINNTFSGLYCIPPNEDMISA